MPVASPSGATSAVNVTRPCAFVNFNAFETRLPRTCCSRVMSPMTHSGSSGSTADSSTMLCSSATCAKESTVPPTRSVSRNTDGRSVIMPFSSDSSASVVDRMRTADSDCFFSACTVDSCRFSATASAPPSAPVRSMPSSTSRSSTSSPTVTAFSGTRTSWNMYRKKASRLSTAACALASSATMRRNSRTSSYSTTVTTATFVAYSNKNEAGLLRHATTVTSSAKPTCTYESNTKNSTITTSSCRAHRYGSRVATVSSHGVARTPMDTAAASCVHPSCSPSCAL
mmetsp:Transcript_1293/g.4081  ORF Transcript_1293/g.4081 Transcript_1293/m.4081 type:complete len:284 (+) Transcript_1293:1012-1863(+)